MSTRSKTATLAALNDVVGLELRDDVRVGVSLSGTMTSMTVTFQVSIDGTNYQSILGLPTSGTQTAVSTATAVGGWTFDCSGFKYFRVKVTTFSSGTITGGVAVDKPANPQSVSLGAVTTDIAHVEDAAASSGDTGAFILGVLGDPLVGPTDSAGTAGDYEAFPLIGGRLPVCDGPYWTSAHGVAGVPFTSADASSVVVCTSAPTSGKKLVIDGLILNAGADVTVTFKEETTGTVILGPFTVLAKTTVVINLAKLGKVKLATADKKLTITAGASGTVTADVYYHSET